MFTGVRWVIVRMLRCQHCVEDEGHLVRRLGDLEDVIVFKVEASKFGKQSVIDHGVANFRELPATASHVIVPRILCLRDEATAVEGRQ